MQYAKRQYPQEEAKMQDGIACYNIGNKYCHTIAMQLMAEGELSFLAIQEPYSARAAGQGTHETWRASETKELDMLRYTSVPSQWQLVIYDNMKWGGRETENPEVHLDGRVITMAFALAPGQKIRIASVYVPAQRNAGNKEERGRREKRQEVAALVRSKLEQWKLEDKEICTIVLGDFQETVTSTAVDDWGAYTKEPAPDGLVATSHGGGGKEKEE